MAPGECLGESDLDPYALPPFTCLICVSEMYGVMVSAFS